MIRPNRRPRIVPVALAVLALGLGALPLAAQTPKSNKGLRFYLSGQGTFVSHSEFPNAFMSGLSYGLVVAGSNDSGLVFRKSDPGYGFSIGIMFSFSEAGQARQANGMYFELTYHPGIQYPDMAESSYRRYYDAVARQFVDETLMFVQTDGKARFMGLNIGGVLIPFRRIPVGVDLFCGLWSCHQEFVSGTVAYYDGRESIQMVKDLLGGDYEGRGKFSKSKIGFVLGAGLKVYPLRFVSIDAKYTLNLVNSRQESTNLYYVDSGETVMNGIAGFGHVTSIGLTFYF
jgi:opacity protein-like surface antigen